MVRGILLLSGHVSAGKTTLCSLLVHQFNAHTFKTKDELLAVMGRQEVSRTELQALGEKLDRQTKGTWLVRCLAPRIDQSPPHRVIVIE